MNILAKIAKWWFNRTHKIITDEEVKTFFINCYSIGGLINKLINSGYTWKGEYYLFDWDKTINEALSVKEINCNDFVSIFVHYLKNLNLSQSCQECYYIYMEDWSVYTILNYFSPKWHSIIIFKLNNKWFIQSNLKVVPLNFDDVENINNYVILYVQDLYKISGYTYFKIKKLIGGDYVYEESV